MNEEPSVTPRVSVIVPIYNVERYLAHCLDSLISQTLHDIEIICVDDASTDNSAAIAEQYAARDARITLTHHAENKGLSASRNTGIALSHTPYLMFCDSDDTYAPTMCEKLLQAIESSPDAAFAMCGIEVTYECLHEIKKSDSNYFRVKHSGKVELTEDILQETDVSACNKIFRKDLLKKYGLTFPEGLKYEDAYFFTLYGLLSSYAVYVPEYLYHYVRRFSSIMSQTFSGRSDYIHDHLHIAFRIHKFLKERHLLQQHLHYFGKFFFSMLNSAIAHEKKADNRQLIFRQAEDFLNREQLDFSCFDDLAYPMYLLRCKRPVGSVRKKWGGLLRIKQRALCAKYYFCGILVKVERSPKH